MTDWTRPLERGRRRPRAEPAPAAGPMSFDRAVEIFIDGWVSEKTGKPYSSTSKANVRGNLLGTPLRSFRQSHGVEHLRDWSDDLAVEFLRWFQHDLHRDSATIKKFRSQLRQFAHFCDERFGTDFTQGNKLATTRVSSAGDDEPNEDPALTKQEAQALLDGTSTDRDRLIVALLLYTGMRPSELLALEETSVQLDREPPTVEIRGSIHDANNTKSAAGFRDIPLTIGQNIIPRLLHKVLNDPSRPVGATRIFLSTRADESERPEPLTLNGLKLMLRQLHVRTGIKCNAYRFRHTFCTWCADAGMHILHMQQLLGHASSHMVAYYYRGRTSDAVLKAAAKIKF